MNDRERAEQSAQIFGSAPLFIWVCTDCKSEYPMPLKAIAHSSFGAADCLACRVKEGDRVPFEGSKTNCPGCHPERT